MNHTKSSIFWETRMLASMQAVSGDVSWQAQIGAV